MSRAFWRSLLTCLLLVALPVSGFASASMLGCTPAHRQALAAPSGTDQMPAMHDHARHEHGHDSAHLSGVVDATPAGQTHSTHTAYFIDSDQCSSCAPCCVGMALFSSPLPRLDTSKPRADFPAADARYRSAWLGNLERPPRHFLA